MSTELIVADKQTQLIKQIVGGLDSVHTRRAYEKHIGEFRAYLTATGQTINKAALNGFKDHLRENGKGDAAINQRLSAARFFIREAADNGLIDEQAAQLACKVKGVQQRGTRLGNWLEPEQAEAIFDAPDTTTALGLRDRAALALLIGAGLRRTEAITLTVEHIQQREGRWVLVDVRGKRNKLRTIPLSPAFKALIDDWCNAAGITSGLILRQCSWGQDKFKVSEEGLSAQGVYRIALRYGAPTGNHKLRPHDMRRTFAKLARKGGAPLEQIQLSLGHENLNTTQKYLGTELDLQNAPSDFIKLKIR